MEHDSVIRDLQKSLDDMRADRNKWRKVADLCVIAIGVPNNDIDRMAVNAYDKAVRGE